MFKLIGALRPGLHHEHHADLYATALAYLSMVRTSRGETDAAHVAWIMAERDRMAGTGDLRVNASVVEALALLAAAEGDPRFAEALLTAALERLAGNPQHALRRYELYCRLAEVVVDAGEIERLPAILARARRYLREPTACWRPPLLPVGVVMPDLPKVRPILESVVAVAGDPRERAR